MNLVFGFLLLMVGVCLEYLLVIYPKGSQRHNERREFMQNDSEELTVLCMFCEEFSLECRPVTLLNVIHKQVIH